MSDIDVVRDYLVSQEGIVGAPLGNMLKKFERNPDVMKEFCQWIRLQSYDIESPISVDGYTAKRIHEMNSAFDGVGVYNFLISLRENPEFASRCIKRGFRAL